MQEQNRVGSGKKHQPRILAVQSSGCGEEDDVGDDKFTIPAGEIDEIGFGLHSELKFGQVPLLRCSDAVRDRFEAEKRASHKEHPILAATWGGAGGFDGGAGEED
ncbi:hypothetical protein L6452_21822 [Arctium lappa]|uniref:Uncharacterized protein n=1 Tax=Arctium lappa TaxID=4217 RepID=A0ACB9AX93_ARCLA|nr:hypothetical protein L6452_21822 [Arctium lappa]